MRDVACWKGIFDPESQVQQQQLLEAECAAAEFWSRPETERAERLRTLKRVQRMLEEWQRACERLEAWEIGLALWAEDATDVALHEEVAATAKEAAEILQEIEVKRLLGGDHDADSAILAVHAGAGGLESSDWAAMLARMYQRWAERWHLRCNTLDFQAGEEPGAVKAMTLQIEGEYAYGKLRTENGVHRLVRLSPFDSNHRRHTSFASVFVYPDVEEAVEVEIREADLRVDTFRAQGAGGQHVNTTDSAVRITHLPTGIAVQCQNQRSQHKNRATAMRVLRARLLQRELAERDEARERQHADKRQIAWGSQIRSYVLHPYRMVKDHRSGYEVGATERVLNGELDDFIERFLLQEAQTAAEPPRSGD